MGKKNRIRIRDDQPGSYFRELRNKFLGGYYLMGIRDGKNWDPGWKTFGSGIRENIPDPQHCAEYHTSRQNIIILFWKYLLDIRSERLG
jgi:hypothetical protein